ncbi:mobile mystery protein A [Gemmatimonadota bacterium]
MSRPDQGWIRAIRESLGMSLRQMAEKMGVSKTTAAALERSEAADSVKIRSLRAVADALECDLVYALVPRTSLEDTVRHRARLIAERTVGRVSETMELEEQGIPASERDRQIEELEVRLWEEMPKELWDEPL